MSGESDVDALVDSWFTLQTAGGQSRNTLTRAEITLLMRRLVDPASSAEVTLEALPSLGALVLFRELLGHYAPDLFGALLRDEASMLVAGPNQNGFGFYWAEHVAGVRDAPEFRPFVLDLGMVEYWQLFGWPKVCRPVGPRDFECD